MCNERKRLDTLDDSAYLGGREWFGQVVESTAPHRIDGAVDRGKRRDDHHRQPRRQACQCLEQVEPRLAAKSQVEKRCVKSRLLDSLQGVGDASRFLDRMVHRLKRDP